MNNLPFEITYDELLEEIVNGLPPKYVEFEDNVYIWDGDNYVIAGSYWTVDVIDMLLSDHVDSPSNPNSKIRILDYVRQAND